MSQRDYLFLGLDDDTLAGVNKWQKLILVFGLAAFAGDVGHQLVIVGKENIDFPLLFAGWAGLFIFTTGLILLLGKTKQ